MYVRYMITVLQYRSKPIKGRSLKGLARTMRRMRRRYRTGTSNGMRKYKKGMLSKQYSNILFQLALRKRSLHFDNKYHTTNQGYSSNYNDRNNNKTFKIYDLLNRLRNGTNVNKERIILINNKLIKLCRSKSNDRNQRKISTTIDIVKQLNEMYEFAFTSLEDDAADDDLNTIGTDAFNIKVDNCASRSMSFNFNDFVPGSLVPLSDKGVRGFGNTITPITHMGTISWSIYDDDGCLHDIQLKESYYVPTGTTRLLSPQHWSQQAKDTYPIRYGTWCGTYDDRIICHWNQLKYKITIPLDPGSSNVGSITSSSGLQLAFEAIAPLWQTLQFHAFDSKLTVPEITPDTYPINTDDDGIPIEIGTIPEGGTIVDNDVLGVKEEDMEVSSQTTTEGIHPLVLPKEDDILNMDISVPVEDLREIKNRMDLKWWHEKLGHISMHSIQHMA